MLEMITYACRNRYILEQQQVFIINNNWQVKVMTDLKTHAVVLFSFETVVFLISVCSQLLNTQNTRDVELAISSFFPIPPLFLFFIIPPFLILLLLLSLRFILLLKAIAEGSSSP